MKPFPVGLTIAGGAAVVILLGLGTWQVQRLHWKQDLLARIEAARRGAPAPLGAALRGGDPAWARVRVECGAFRDVRPLYGLSGGEIVWRAVALCDGADGPVVVDRGVIDGSEGLVAAPKPPASVEGATLVGVVRPLDGPRAAQARDAGWPAARWFVSVESESPPPAGLRADPLPTDVPNNHLGYAITWYGLAAALVGVYLALLRKRLRS